MSGFDGTWHLDLRMLRRLDKDGRRYTSCAFDRGGVVNRIRPFNRVD